MYCAVESRAVLLNDPEIKSPLINLPVALKMCAAFPRVWNELS